MIITQSKPAASMGPRFCKRGNSARRSPRSRPEGLQWGHAFVSVETIIISARYNQVMWLQWGHAFVSVETCYRPV